MTESSKKMPVARPRRRDQGRRPAGQALVAMLVTVLALAILPGTATAATVESRTTHVRLGFTSTFPISDVAKDGVAGVEYEFSATGTATLAVALGADITVTYDRKDLVPGGTVPVNVTFTPTDDPGPEFDLDVRADLVADVDVSAGTYVAACLPGSPLNPLCPVLATVDTVDERVAGFQLAGVTGDFVAPLGSDAPVVLSGSGDSATLRFVGLDLLSAKMAANVTVGPVGPGAVPGLGGAVTVARATGAALVGGETPGVDVLGWFARGSTQTVSLQLPASPGASAGVDLSPIFHWLQMSANVSVDLDFEGDFDALPDPGAIEVFSGSLGKVFVDNGVDVQIGSAVKNTIGFDPGFAAQVQAGNLPVALTEPAIAVIQPPPSSLPPLGRVSVAIDLDADDDGLLDGQEIARGLDPDDADSDDDGLTDGAEVDVHHTDPLDADSDDDGLTDGAEIDAHHTDPLDADSDDDGLTDGAEVQFGVDPRDADTDDDGLVDGQDVEFIQNAVGALSGDVFKAAGLRTATTSRLDSVEKSMAQGHPDQALDKLGNLRAHFDGCGVAADGTDWIVACARQGQVRDLIDILAANIS